VNGVLAGTNAMFVFPVFEEDIGQGYHGFLVVDHTDDIECSLSCVRLLHRRLPDSDVPCLFGLPGSFRHQRRLLHKLLQSLRSQVRPLHLNHSSFRLSKACYVSSLKTYCNLCFYQLLILKSALFLRL